MELCPDTTDDEVFDAVVVEALGDLEPSRPGALPSTPCSGTGLAFALQLREELQHLLLGIETDTIGGDRHIVGGWWRQAAAHLNGPTEAANNLLKRVKRAAFGFTGFRNYRIRTLLYAGKPNWDLLPTVTPR